MLRQGAPCAPPGSTTATQPIPGNACGGGKAATPALIIALKAALMTESAVSCWEKYVPLYLPQHMLRGEKVLLTDCLWHGKHQHSHCSWQHFRAGFSQGLTVPKQFLQYVRHNYSFLPISHAGLSCTNTVANNRQILSSSYAKCLQCPCGQFHGCWWRTRVCSSGHRVSPALCPCTPTLGMETCTRDPVLL